MTTIVPIANSLEPLATSTSRSSWPSRLQSFVPFVFLRGSKKAAFNRPAIKRSSGQNEIISGDIARSDGQIGVALHP